MAYVYRFLNEKDNTIYIGKTCRKLESRMEEHFGGKGHLDKECYIELDYTKLEFYNGSTLVHKAIGEYDRINAMFLNHVTAKEFVGEKYDPVVESRVAAVEAHYQDFFTKIDNEYAADLAAVQNVDSKAIVEKNKPLIQAKTLETKEYINSLIAIGLNIKKTVILMM